MVVVDGGRDGGRTGGTGGFWWWRNVCDGGWNGGCCVWLVTVIHPHHTTTPHHPILPPSLCHTFAHPLPHHTTHTFGPVVVFLLWNLICDIMPRYILLRRRAHTTHLSTTTIFALGRGVPLRVQAAWRVLVVALVRSLPFHGWMFSKLHASPPPSPPSLYPTTCPTTTTFTCHLHSIIPL